MQKIIRRLCLITVFLVTVFIALFIGVVFGYNYIKQEEQMYYSLDAKIKRTEAIYNKLKLFTGQATVPMHIINSTIVNAWTDGEQIIMTTGILNAMDTDDEIAGVLAHEMAHVMLQHVTGPSNLTTTDKEAHADKMGTYLVLRAGFDVCEAREFWLVLQNSGDGDFADPLFHDHPSYAYRYYAESMPWCLN